MTDTSRVQRHLADIAALLLRLQAIDSTENRARLMKEHNDSGLMYAEMYGGAEMIAQQMADSAARAQRLLAEVTR